MKHKIIIGIFLGAFVLFGVYYFSHPKTITNHPSKGADIIAFGDSLVEGVGATTGNDFVSLLSQKIGQPIINLGISGNTTADGLARINELDEYNPKVVILLLGGNDYLKKIPVADTFKNLTAIIKKIQARGSVVLLLGIQGGILKDNYDTEFKNLRDTYHTAFVSNVLDGLLGNAKYMSDTIHPNNLGYQKIADRVYPVLKTVLAEN